MRTSSIRLIRKLAGIVLLVINTMLSLVSALALYSIVEFASNQNNYDFEVASPITYNFTISPNGYINLGTMHINNTGIFDFDDFEVKFKFKNNETGTPVLLMSYNGTFPDIKAGEKQDVALNLKNSTTSSFWVSPGLLNITSIDSDHVVGSLTITGKYVLSLFRFDFAFQNLTTWSWI
ncbi:MAG: hypothetical protein JW839_15000 [Candidatus Lokiarchaeota archaeon]|nr:hypothetical protein [Candidatus Lokiarchaeota archaeon]